MGFPSFAAHEVRHAGPIRDVRFPPAWRGCPSDDIPDGWLSREVGRDRAVAEKAGACLPLGLGDGVDAAGIVLGDEADVLLTGHDAGEAADAVDSRVIEEIDDAVATAKGTVVKKRAFSAFGDRVMIQTLASYAGLAMVREACATDAR